MRQESYLTAVNEAMRLAMRRDPSVFIIGEDVAGGGRPGHTAAEAWGGVYGATKGLLTEFGPGRVLDTPISETAFIGAAIGASAAGMRAVVELMHADFIGVCFDQILNQAAKLRYMSGGQVKVPVTIRTTIGGGFRAASHHSQALYSIFAHIPGLKCVVPSTPYDAKGLLAAAIQDDDPVVVFENKTLYGSSGPLPEEEYTIPLGQGDIKRRGKDVTVVAVSRMVHVALAAADRLAAEGIEVEVVDPRTIFPLDEQLILESLSRTHRLVVVDEDTPFCGFAAEILAMAFEKGMDEFDAPPRRVTAPHSPVPFSPTLEDAFLPSPERVIAAVKEML